MITPHPDPGSFVVITLKDVYDVAQETRANVVTLTHQTTSIQNQTVDLEARMRTVERARWPIPTLAVLIALASAVIAAASLLTR